MKYIKNKLVNFINYQQNKSRQIKLIKDISFLNKSHLSTSELELFLDVKLTDFDETYLNLYFKEYVNLNKHLNILQIIEYIDFNERFKTELKSLIIKKFFYPSFLIIFAFGVFSLFKFSIIKMLDVIVSITLLYLINSLYFLSLFIIISIVILLVFVVYLFKHPAYFLMIYNRIYQFRFLKAIELYYLNILSHLLLSFYQEGLSTHQIFKLINQFKGSTVIANIAYFLNSDLEAGKSLEASILGMKINDNFKNVLLFGIKSNNFERLLEEYSNKLKQDLIFEVEFLSKSLYLIAYLYIGIIVVLLYKVISLPINMIDTF